MECYFFSLAKIFCDYLNVYVLIFFGELFCVVVVFLYNMTFVECSLVKSQPLNRVKSVTLFLIGFSKESLLTNKELTVVKSFVTQGHLLHDMTLKGHVRANQNAAASCYPENSCEGGTEIFIHPPSIQPPKPHLSCLACFGPCHTCHRQDCIVLCICPLGCILN